MGSSYISSLLLYPQTSSSYSVQAWSKSVWHRASGCTILIQLLTALITDPVKWPLCGLKVGKLGGRAMLQDCLGQQYSNPPSPRSWHELKCNTHRPDCLTPHVVRNNVLLSKLGWTGVNRQWRVLVSCHMHRQHPPPVPLTSMTRWNSAMSEEAVTRRADFTEGDLKHTQKKVRDEI